VIHRAIDVGLLLLVLLLMYVLHRKHLRELRLRAQLDVLNLVLNRERPLDAGRAISDARASIDRAVQTQRGTRPLRKGDR